jgi:GntR family transcriptional repressor for pyruvate dehydrogenase complex
MDTSTNREIPKRIPVAKLKNLSGITVPRPSDIVARRIRELLAAGTFKPGERLPPERDLARRLGVGRSQVRDALKKLEFFGVLRTLPQNGTVVDSLGAKALHGFMANVLNLERKDFQSLMHTRALLEVNAARLAARRADESRMREIREAHEAFRACIEQGRDGLEEDLFFHLRIAEAAESTVLCSLIGIMTPEILSLTRDLRICDTERTQAAFLEHEDIIKGILARDPGGAARAMAVHIKNSRRKRND